MRRNSLLLAGAAFASMLLWSLPVSADTTVSAADPFAGITSLQPVSDATLATMRGRYIAPIRSHVPLPAPDSLTTMPQPFTAQAAVRTPQSAAFSNLPAGGEVTYFGVEMVSSWSTQTGSATVGATIGIDAAAHTFTITDWSGAQGDGLQGLSNDGDSVSGSSPSQNVNGVTQNIQVAGNGNTVANTATLTVSQQGNSFTIVPTMTTCGSVCTTVIGANSVGVEIRTGAGTAMQQIGAGGITQSVRLAGNDNAILNAMQLNARIQLPSSFNAGSMLPILQTVNGFIP
jgi:hypothetical protein